MGRLARMVESFQEKAVLVVQCPSTSVEQDALPTQIDHCSTCLQSSCHTDSCTRNEALKRLQCLRFSELGINKYCYAFIKTTEGNFSIINIKYFVFTFPFRSAATKQTRLQVTDWPSLHNGNMQDIKKPLKDNNWCGLLI